MLYMMSIESANLIRCTHILYFSCNNFISAIFTTTQLPFAHPFIRELKFVLPLQEFSWTNIPRPRSSYNSMSPYSGKEAACKCLSLVQDVSEKPFSIQGLTKLDNHVKEILILTNTFVIIIFVRVLCTRFLTRYVIGGGSEVTEWFRKHHVLEYTLC